MNYGYEDIYEVIGRYCPKMLPYYADGWYGSCPYCRDNRLVGNKRLAEKIIALLAERGEALTD